MRLREVEAFATELMTDGHCGHLRPLPRILRRRVATLVSRWRRARLIGQLRRLGGQTPEGAHTADVAAALERTLNGRTFPSVVWQVTTAFRYGGRTLADARADLAAQGVDRVLSVALVPPGLHPVAASLRDAWTDHGGAPGALVSVPPLADALAAAVRERIHEALQRFPVATRDAVHVLFAVHPAAHVEADEPTRASVASVLRQIPADELAHPSHVAFGRAWGLAIQQAPGVEDELAALVRAGVRHVLVVPIGYLCESMDTAYELDVAMRAHGLELGLVQMEVAAAIGPHRDLIDALAERLVDALPGAVPLETGPATVRKAA